MIRKQNKISQMLDSVQLDFDRIKSELFKLAELKYDCCIYNENPMKTAEIKAVLENQEQLNTLDIGLFKACISRIWISRFCTIEIEFINGVIIKNIMERTEKNAYSTEQEEQQNSYHVHIAYYTDLINRKKEWTLAGIFADKGISGTQTKKRTEFNRMIRMCKKIDLVITRLMSRFARNTMDCLEYVRQLKDIGIGVIFEKENTLTAKVP